MKVINYKNIEDDGNDHKYNWNIKCLVLFFIIHIYVFTFFFVFYHVIIILLTQYMCLYRLLFTLIFFLYIYVTCSIKRTCSLYHHQSQVREFMILYVNDCA